MSNKKKKRQTKNNDDCIELSEKQLEKIAAGKYRYPEQREVN